MVLKEKRSIERAKQRESRMDMADRKDTKEHLQQAIGDQADGTRRENRVDKTAGAENRTVNKAVRAVRTVRAE